MAARLSELPCDVTARGEGDGRHSKTTDGGISRLWCVAKGEIQASGVTG